MAQFHFFPGSVVSGLVGAASVELICAALTLSTLFTGVLLLNAVLTVRAHQANSHKERGWEQFTDAVVSWLNQNLTGLVFLLWGSYAQKKGSAIDRVCVF